MGKRLKHREFVEALDEYFGDRDWDWDDDNKEFLEEAAAECYGIAYKVVSQLEQRVADLKVSYSQLEERLEEMRRQRDERANELGRAHDRIKELEPPGKPDPLALALPRKRGPDAVVSGQLGPGPTVALGQEPWCPGDRFIADEEPSPGTAARCATCGRLIKPQNAGVPYRHKWGGFFNKLYWEHVSEGNDPLGLASG